MADKFHPGSPKSQIAQQVIRMDMRINHITDGSVGHFADRTIQCLPFCEAAACIDYGNTAISDHKTDVRNMVAFKYDCSMPGPDVYTWSHLHNLSRC